MQIKNKKNESSKPSIQELKLCTGGALGNAEASKDAAAKSDKHVVGVSPVL